MLGIAAVRIRLPHRDDFEQIVAGIRRSEDGFAEKRRCEARPPSLRQIPANGSLTAANLGNRAPHCGESRQIRPHCGHSHQTFCRKTPAVQIANLTAAILSKRPPSPRAIRATNRSPRPSPTNAPHATPPPSDIPQQTVRENPWGYHALTRAKHARPSTLPTISTIVFFERGPDGKRQGNAGVRQSCV